MAKRRIYKLEQQLLIKILTNCAFGNIDPDTCAKVPKQYIKMNVNLYLSICSCPSSCLILNKLTANPYTQP